MADEEETTAVSYRARLAHLSSLAFVFPVSIGIFTFVGYMLDGKLAIFPWLTLLFFSLGVLAGFINLIRAVKLFDRKE